MPVEVSSLPGGGGLILSVLAYVGLSTLAGQMISERMIERSGWEVECAASVVAAARPTPRIKQHVPQMRCSETLGMFGRELRALCREFGDPDFNGAARRTEEEARKKQKQLEELRLSRAAANAGTQCGCAANVHQSDHVVSWALYAGTARLISPPVITNLKTSLRVSLGSTQCQAMGGTGS